MAGQLGALNLDGGDVRMGSNAGMGIGADAEITRSRQQKLHDPNVTFEEYIHYASITRADTRHEASQGANTYTFSKPKSLNPFSFRKAEEAYSQDPRALPQQFNEKGSPITSGSGDESPGGSPYVITDEEYIQASRAVRTAAWGAVFYLITTDILGPFSTA